MLDPIDGTRNFVRGIPIWATLVGLEYKGEQIAGVAEAPGLGMTWRALRGDGAYRGERRIRVSDVGDLSRSMLFYSSLSWFIKAGRQDAVPGVDAARRNGNAASAISMVTCWWPRERAKSWSNMAFMRGTSPRSSRSWRRPAAGSPTGTIGADMTRPDVIVSNGKLHDEVLAILAARNEPHGDSEKH